jgi:hypothetical protein
MSNQPSLKCLIGREAFEISGRVYRWEDVFLCAMARGDWEWLLDRFRLTLVCATASRAASRRIASRHVEEAAEAFRYAHKLETAAAMRNWLRYWRLTPERWRQAILLQAIETRLTDADKPSLAKSVQPSERQIIHWLRPLGAVSGAFQELADSVAGHAAIHDSLQRSAVPEEGSKPPTDAGIDDGINAAAAIYLGLGPEEVRSKSEHLLAIEWSTERFRQSVATPDAIRRQIAGNLVGWTQIRYEVLTCASAAAAREAADCIRLDGEAPEEVAARAGIVMEQTTRFYTELERPLAAILLSAGTNQWIGPVEIGGRHLLFRIRGKTPPRADDRAVVDCIASYLFTQAMDKERRARVRWRFPF